VFDPPTPTPGPNAPRLFEVRRFAAETISQDGRPIDLVAGTSLDVTFLEEFCGFIAKAGCRLLGTWTVRYGRLVQASLPFADGNPLVPTSPCPDAVRAQDEALKAFFASGPAVSFNDGKLAIVGGSTVVWFSEVETD
jgi:hypothetical protein